MPFPVPANLRQSVTTRGSPELTDWVAALPDRVADLGRRWALEVSPPFEPGGSASWVAPAHGTRGRDAVLKIAWSHTEGRDEAEGLSVFGGEGAVEVHAYEHDGSSTAMLLERCRPGHALRNQPEAEQHEVIAELLRRLWRVPLPVAHRFRPLFQLCDAWADQSALAHAAGPGFLDPGLVRDGLELFRTLPRTATESALLCTDLHAGNVLAGTRRPWLLIDPKPYVGDPHYDVIQHLLNCADALRRDPVGLLRQMADLTGLDPVRVQQWLFARCVQESPGWPGLAPVAVQVAPRTSVRGPDHR